MNNLSKEIFVLFILSAVFISCSNYQAELPETEKMNIIQIVVEDWSAFAVGAYGNDVVKTPNVDRLAKKGMMFNRAYCQAPVCNPSRSSFTTGLRPDAVNVYHNAEHMDKYVPEGTKFLPEIVNVNGATTLSFGKLVHKWWQSERFINGFDYVDKVEGATNFTGTVIDCPEIPSPTTLEKNGYTYVPNKEVDDRLKRLMKEREEKRAAGHPDNWDLNKPYQQLHAEQIGNSGLEDDEMEDGHIAACVTEKLADLANTGEQFFMSVGFYSTHTPLLAPKKYVDMYNPDEIPLTPAPRNKDKNVPDVAVRNGSNYDIFNGMYPEYQPTEKRQKEAIAAYYACASYVDAQVGRIMDALEKNDLADNTIIVFFSDHGFNLGEHGTWSKFTLFEQSTKVPFIVYIPGSKNNGKEVDGIVELVDVVPTYCDLWGIEKLEEFESTSMVPLLEQPEREWKKAAYTMITLGGLGRSVRTKQFKYAEYRTTREFPTDEKPFAKELYDLENDPYEQNNLADLPEYTEKQKELEQLLFDGWESALPKEKL